MYRSLFLLALARAILGAPLQEAASSKAVDYVIIGGGPAGFVLVEAISRNASKTVVLLEAGPDGINDTGINTPALYPTLNQYVWNYTVIPDPGLAGNTPQLNQGRVFGGGGGVNGMAYCRGSESLFDDWATASGNKGLAWKSMLEAFKETSHYSSEHGVYDDYVNTTAYGNGPIEISRSTGTGTTNFDKPFGQALQSQLSLPEVDLTDGHGIGVDYGLSNIWTSNRTRSYGRNTFGALAAARPNVKLLSGAWAHHIGFSGKTATNVTYLDLKKKVNTTLVAREIIISGGAINTPKLLLQNGIGPSSTLNKYKIPVVADIPAVGQNLWDHLFPIVEVKVPDDILTVWQWADNATEKAIAQQQYAQNHSGPLSWDNGLVYGAFRVPDSVFDGVNGSHYVNLQKDRPHVLIEYSTVPFFSGVANQSVVTAWASLVQPEAAGYVSISSTDFHTDPVIQSNYYGSPADKKAIFWAYKKLRAIMSSSALSSVVETELYPGPNVQTDDQIWNAIQQQSFSFHHPMGTVAIGKALDSNWRLKGLKGIRVVDSSAFPYATTCHPHASVYALAVVAARDIVAADHY
ncbi:hypothetical protein AMS68_004770 [Peltaster fructicola]|uniref:Glucose-methanol-choline oxidoreductase N-terminal domain-containing protein n=1 Tax=Peltaster fructicola TaxID=286661 RepID=A0A6H0XWY0_9PEZI|nr:hypothetical protein AMS68_004770 [Peltaster fructicola]